MKSGILLVDKPTQITSHDVVNCVRKSLNQRDVGHAGTLDPLASGLMVLLIGEATKLSDVIMDGTKKYEVQILFGLETDSWDITGEKVKETFDFNLEKDTFLNVASSLLGDVELQVPPFSAVKVDGVKLYKKAHKKEETPEVFRTMKFWNLEVVEFSPKSALIRLECSKGAYIRSWVQTLGKRLECGATVEKLTRLKSLPFGLEEASALDDENLSQKIIPMHEVLKNWPRVAVSGFEEKLIRNGQIPVKVELAILRSTYQVQSDYAFVVQEASKNPLCFVYVDQQRKVHFKRGFHVDSFG